MNKIQKIIIDKKKAARLFALLMICFCLLPLLINSAVLSPMTEVLSSNVLYSESVILYLIDYLMALLEIIAFAVSFSIIIFSVFLGSKKITCITSVIFAISCFLQIPIKILMNVPLYGTVGTLKNVVLSCIPMLGYLLFCLLHLLIVYLIAITLRKRYMMPARLRKRRGISDQSGTELLPIKKIYDSKNPLQRSAIFTCAVIVALKIILHLYGDVFFGFPEDLGGIISLITSYLVDVAYGFVAYIVALLIFGLAYDKLKAKDTDEESSPSDDVSILD